MRQHMVDVFKMFVSNAIGQVSAEVISPAQPMAMLTLAHGAGAGMHHPFIMGLAQALCDNSIATLRFNFPFIEKKSKPADVPAVAHQTIACAIRRAQQLLPNLPLFAGGKSFGGRMSSQWLAVQQNTNIKGIIFFGFPLHPAGKPGTNRADHLKHLALPKLFLQGSKDELAQWQLLTSVIRSLQQTTLIELPGADHAFKRGKEDLVPLLAQRTANWVRQVLA